jgi:hypothetical protein
MYTVGAGGVAHVEDSLPSKHEALSLSSSTARNAPAPKVYIVVSQTHLEKKQH